MFNSIFEREET